MTAPPIIPSDPAKVLHLVDLFRDFVTIDDLDVPYLASAQCIAQLIVDAKGRLTAAENAMLLGVGVILLRRRAASAGPARLSEIIAERHRPSGGTSR